ncbi:fibrous sheath CABYR-binding protein-like [Drosophila subobscura]|uniref:fibrous sheath CABYR-binding protein-like n=1 Tax=Drosophila subobscura TaxID=7241 RepID=UPI00155ABEF7|nr:fibrous sheath CABYR-binding protein-like [Drosophila subobscura]
MRSVLFVFTAALLLWGNVAGREPPKAKAPQILEPSERSGAILSPKAKAPQIVEPASPKADEPEAKEPKADDKEAGKLQKSDEAKASKSPEADAPKEPKSPKAEQSETANPPVEDIPEMVSKRSLIPGNWHLQGNSVVRWPPLSQQGITRRPHDLIVLERYWTTREKYTEEGIQRLDKKIPEMRKKYALSIQENKNLTQQLEAANLKLYDATLELKKAEQQREKCKDSKSEELDRESLPSTMGREFTNRYLRLLKTLRVTIDRELRIVTNSLWRRLSRREGTN